MSNRISYPSDSGFLRLLPADHRPAIPGGPQSVAEVLDDALASCPDAEALVSRYDRLTYAELDRRVQCATGLLHSMGVEPGDRVAASLPNCSEIVIAFLAVLRLGAIWVGLNNNLALEEKARLVVHAGANVLLIDAETRTPLEARPEVSGCRMITVAPATRDCEWRRLLEDSPILGRQDVDPFAPAIIMYTSGSTGTPKGIVHSQHSLVLLAAVQRSLDVYPSGMRYGVSLALTIGNVMMLHTLPAFIDGGCCVVIDRIDANGLAQWVREERIELLWVPPPILYDLTHSGEVSADDLMTLKRFGSGGSACSPELRAAFTAKYGIEVNQAYGLTEVPCTVTEAFTETHFITGSNGVPYPHLSVAIRDEGNADLPPNTEGEICVFASDTGPFAGTHTGMLGYWGSDMPAEIPLDGSTLLTGDIGLLDDDGQLYVKGRKKNIILRGGASVYPEEIEFLIERDDRVVAAAVIGLPDERLGERVTAFVQLQPGSEVTEDELRAVCANALARYKVPERFDFIEELPRNAMGKVLKPQLVERLGGMADGETS